MSNKPIIYLAGGMEKAGEFGRIWRTDMTPHLEELGYEVWNPYKKELEVGTGPEKISELKYTDYKAYLKCCQDIVDYDIACLITCKAVVVRIDGSVLQGAGSYGELTVCRIHRIPVYAWINLPEGKYDVPAWAMGCITEYTTDKDEFYAMVPRAVDTYWPNWELCDR